MKANNDGLFSDGELMDIQWYMLFNDSITWPKKWMDVSDVNLDVIIWSIIEHDVDL